MAKYLQDKYPGRLTVIWGDSTKTMPEFRRMNPHVKCDLIIIDGGHTEPIATADLKNFHQLANTQNIVVMDDYPTKLGLGKILGPIWEDQIKNGTLIDLYGCVHLQGRGFALGHFLV